MSFYCIVGMWADDDSDEERRGFGSGGGKNKDYSAPVDFVSGGIKVGDKVTKEKADDEADTDEVRSDGSGS